MHRSSSSPAGDQFLGSTKEGHGLKPSAREAGTEHILSDESEAAGAITQNHIG
jgi:hypothetical protein